MSYERTHRVATTSSLRNKEKAGTTGATIYPSADNPRKAVMDSINSWAATERYNR